MNTKTDVKSAMLYNDLEVNGAGHLMFAGADTASLAEKYGTALMLMDEDKMRARCRTYVSEMKRCFGDGSIPLFASKALSFKKMYGIVADEGMGTDIVSSGELYTAHAAGFPMEKAYFHGNNKTDEDIRLAIRYGIGCFVVDNNDELDALDRIAGEAGVCQKILLRLTPGIDPHTHKAITTGTVDSKFGTVIGNGQAEEIVVHALSCRNVELEGFHCHIGSQIFDVTPFCEAADIMIKFIREMSDRHGFTASKLNLGGGFGVRYVESQPEPDYGRYIETVAGAVDKACVKCGVTRPVILMEPGRSIVADCGITLYTVGSVKEIRGFKNYVSVDGGMPDNPRYALYQADYTVLNASRAGDTADYVCSIAGRCCESGDLIQENVKIAKPRRGDLLAVLTTGAYNYSMASNYNRVCRPPVVMISGGRDYLAVKRETPEYLTALDE